MSRFIVSYCKRDCLRTSFSEVNSACAVLIANVAIQAAAAVNMSFLEGSWCMFIPVNADYT